MFGSERAGHQTQSVTGLRLPTPELLRLFEETQTQKNAKKVRREVHWLFGPVWVATFRISQRADAPSFCAREQCQTGAAGEAIGARISAIADKVGKHGPILSSSRSRELLRSPAMLPRPPKVRAGGA